MIMRKLLVIGIVVGGTIIGGMITGCTSQNIDKEENKITPQPEFTQKISEENNKTQASDDTQENSKQHREYENFFVKNKNTTVYIGDWDNEVKLEDIFGNMLSEDVVMLGPGSDTYKGSYVKTLQFHNVKVVLFSPPNNGKTYWIQNIVFTSGDFEILNGIKVGDHFNAVKEKLSTQLKSVDTSDKEQTYAYAFDDANTIQFIFEDDTLKKIDLLRQLQ